MIGRIISAVIGIIIVAAIAWALWPRPIAVETATVDLRDLTITVEEEGTSRIRDVFTVSAPVAGQLLRTTLQIGDDVVAGTSVVASIQPMGPGLLDERTRKMAEAAADAARAGIDLADIQLTQAQAQLAFAEDENGRAVILAEKGLIPERAFEKAQLDLTVARQQVESAKAALEVRQRELDSAQAALLEGQGGDGSGACCELVLAPVTGRVLSIPSESAQVVQAGTPLVEIGNPQDMEIVVELLSRDAVRVDVGARATISGWGGSDLLAEVNRVNPAAVTRVSALGIEEQRATVRLRLLDPPLTWRRLGHGFRVIAHIVVWQGTGLLTVPASALFRQGGDWAAFVVTDGKAMARVIELGERNAEYAEVRSGLAQGETVIVYPGDTIADGVGIVVQNP